MPRKHYQLTQASEDSPKQLNKGCKGGPGARRAGRRLRLGPPQETQQSRLPQPKERAEIFSAPAWRVGGFNHMPQPWYRVRPAAGRRAAGARAGARGGQHAPALTPAPAGKTHPAAARLAAAAAQQQHRGGGAQQGAAGRPGGALPCALRPLGAGRVLRLLTQPRRVLRLPNLQGQLLQLL